MPKNQVGSFVCVVDHYRLIEFSLFPILYLYCFVYFLEEFGFTLNNTILILIDG